MQLSTFSFHTGSGWSVDQFPALDSAQTLVLVFGAQAFIERPGVLNQLVQTYPNSVLAGCSTSGEISGNQVNDESLSVAVARFEHTQLRLAETAVDKAGSLEAGARLGQQLYSDDLTCVLTLTDGLNINGSAFAQGISSILPPNIVVSGGLAGDGRRFQDTWVIGDGQMKKNTAIAIGFYGSRLRIAHGTCGGWEGFGPERQVTRSDGNVLYELDGKPALALYKEYLGEHAAELPGSALFFPLSIKKPDGSGKQLVRCIAAVDEAEQSITFSGDIPQGYLARLTQADFGNLVNAASEAAGLAQRDTGEVPMLAIAVSCVGRRIVMGERTDEELEITLKNLPAGSRQVGFYSYGEIAPYPGQACTLYNQTMTLTTLCEEQA